MGRRLGGERRWRVPVQLLKVLELQLGACMLQERGVLGRVALERLLLLLLLLEELLREMGEEVGGGVGALRS